VICEFLGKLGLNDDRERSTSGRKGEGGWGLLGGSEGAFVRRETSRNFGGEAIALIGE